MTEATETAAAPRERKPKDPTPIVVGVWNPNGAFVPNPKQPDAATALEFGMTVAWARSNLGHGTYEFIRRVPKKLTLAPVTAVSAKLS